MEEVSLPGGAGHHHPGGCDPATRTRRGGFSSAGCVVFHPVPNGPVLASPVPNGPVPNGPVPAGPRLPPTLPGQEEDGRRRGRLGTGNQRGTRPVGEAALLGLHAAGFSGRTLEPLLRRILDDVAGRETRTRLRWCAATVDLPGHGRAAPAVGSAYPWRRVARSLVDALDARDPVRRAGAAGSRPIAIGHSLGGAIALLAEAERPGLFRAVVAYEPVIAPPWLLGNDPATGLAEPTRRRRAHFDSRNEAGRHFSSRPPFSRFAPEVLDAYLADGLVSASTGDDHLPGADSVRLALDPRSEAEVYLGLLAADPWPLLPAVRCPVLVLSGAASTIFAPALAAAITAHLPQGELRVLEELDHFGPLTSPERVADEIAGWLVSDHLQPLDAPTD